MTKLRLSVRRILTEVPIRVAFEVDFSIKSFSSTIRYIIIPIMFFHMHLHVIATVIGDPSVALWLQSHM